MFDKIKKLFQDVNSNDINAFDRMTKKQKLKKMAFLKRRIEIIDAVLNATNLFAVAVDMVLAFADAITNRALVKETIAFMVIVIVVAFVFNVVLNFIKAKLNALLEVLNKLLE